MALYEFYCRHCDFKFEQILSQSSPEYGKCPKCKGKKETERVISKFAVGGRGDLRETTLHGCHEHDPSPLHDHDHKTKKTGS